MREPARRLLVLSDVPVIAGSRGNSEALARLLEYYPSESLVIVQTQGVMPLPEQRIPCLGYHRWAVPWDRFLRTRLSVPANILKTYCHRFGWKRYVRAAEDLAPDAIISLVKGNGWVLAARIAAALEIPLHLIIHDGPSHFQLNQPLSGGWLTNAFKDACQQAATRWSICAALDQHITEMTGVPGQVLPPFRKRGDKGTPTDSLSVSNKDAVYFGALESSSITAMMNDLARVMERLGGRLHAFGGVSPNVAASNAWQNRQFTHHGAFDDRDAFLKICRVSYGFMYLPFSFDDLSTEFSFPSKLIDYSLVGLPILIQAPPSSPLGVWCIENSEAALFVREAGEQALGLAVRDLMNSPELRLRLAHGALAAGARDFEFDANCKRFYEAISDK